MTTFYKRGMLNVQTEPFRHAVLDRVFFSYEIGAASASWPDDDWGGWFCYDSALERKRTCNLWGAMPVACRSLLVAMMTSDVASDFATGPIAPDPLLWGAGLSSMAAGEHLDLHLDHDIHPKTKLLRRVNCLLFVGDWRPGWGGKLGLWDRERQAPQVEIEPMPGRLVLFEASDVSYHSVSRLTCPAEARRKALSCYWYALPEGPAKRPRAAFVAQAGTDDGKDELRNQRASL